MRDKVLLLSLVLSAIIVLSFVFVQASAFAKTDGCNSQKVDSETVAKAVAIFEGFANLGMVLQSDSSGNTDTKFYNFAVSNAWKGVKNNDHVVVVGKGSSDYHFKNGIEYLVFADGIDEDGQFFVSACGHTTPATDAEGIRDNLRKLMEQN